MSGIKSSTNNYNQDTGLPKTPPKNSAPVKKIEIADYDNNQTKTQDVEKFKTDISNTLGAKSEDIVITTYKNGLTAKVKGSLNEVPIEFKDNLDLSKIAKYSATSSSPTLINFGDDKNDRKIKISNYTNGLTKEAKIQLFKDDIAREMKTEIKHVEVFVIDDKIVARKKDGSDNYIVEFTDPADGAKFMDYAKETLSKRLQDFGIKKHEGMVTIGANTNLGNPKTSTVFSEDITYSTYLGDSGNQRLSFNLNSDMNMAGKFEPKNIKNFSIAYQNMDLPFIGNFGEIKLNYGNGKFGIDGKSDALDIEADKIGKKYINDMKHGDAKAIAITAGVVAGVGAGLYIAKDQLKEAHDLDLPIKTSIYNNGVNTIKAVVAPTVTVGGGELDLSMHKAGVEVKQNIATGINFREQSIYDFKNKEINTEFEGNYNRSYLRLSNKYSMENSNLNETYISLGTSRSISEKTNIYGQYSQKFDRDFKSSEQSLSIGMDYSPNENWRINAGAGLARPVNETKIAPTVGFSISRRF